MILTRAVGIDLGTTNSAVAILDANERDLLLCKDQQGRATVPSCVWWDSRAGKVVVGYPAYARRGGHPEPITSIKRSMGTRMTVRLGDRDMSPAEVSGAILQELTARAKAEIAARQPEGVRYDLSRAIITVPAYFGLPAVEATREAGNLAGLQVTELLHEPTAAAIYYSWKHDLGDGVYMVYDLGGGTFDVSILRRTAGEFLVLGISGDNFLGGDDFDRRLAEHIRQVLVADGYEMDLDVSGDPEDQLRHNQLVVLAEKAKRGLSDYDEVVVRDNGTVRDKADTPVIVETTLMRTAFEQMIGDLLDRTIVCCQTALERARAAGDVSIENVDHILLVGGSTYVPAVVRKVQEAFGAGGADAIGSGRAAAPPIRDEPDTAVALGAALRAAATTGLGVGDGDRRVRLWFRGTGATRRQDTAISGSVEALDPELDLEGGLVRLLASTGEVLDEQRLALGGRFTFSDVELRPDTLNQFEFELLGADGAVVASLHRGIVHATDQKEAVGRALSTAVLSKAIVLEGTDGDRLMRTTLLPAGTSLPTEARFTFALADAGGRIRLPIYQESRIIKELSAAIGDFPVGTPVDLLVACDEQVHIHVRFTVGDAEFGGRIEPPPPDTVPTEHEVQQISRDFLDALQCLEEADALRLRGAYEQARRDLDEARNGADHPKVIQRAADLQGLVRDARLAEPLRPPLERTEASYQSCLELLPKAVQQRPDIGKSSLEAHLKHAMDCARDAYRRRDRQAYVDMANVVTASLQYLSGVTRVQATGDESVDVAVRAVMALDQAREMMQVLFISCLMSGKGDFVPVLGQYVQEINALEERLGNEPVDVLNRCQVLVTEARRIYSQIAPEEQADASLQGLLHVGGHGAGPDKGLSRGLFDKG